MGLIFMGLAYMGMACDGCNVYTPAGINNSQNRLSLLARQRSTFGEFSQLGEMITKHSGHANDLNIWGAEVLEQYQTYELRGDFFVKEKWQISFVLPVTNNRQFLGDRQRFNLTGLSDPTLLLGYHIVSENTSGLKQRLSFGAGAKMPLGLIDLQKDGFRPNLDFQPGTGAASVLGFANYFVTNGKWSGFMSANYKWNGSNSLNYQYGKTFNAQTDLFWQTNIANHTLMLQVGLYGELAGHDRSFAEHEDTGGLILFGTTGLRYLTSSFILQAEYQPVISQQLYGTTQLLTKNRINIGLTYVLANNKNN